MSIPSLNPFKKEVVLMSPLKGTLLKGGRPLANAELEVSILMPDGEERFFTHYSNSEGVFDLPVIKDTMVLGPMTQFAVSQWVHVIVDGEKKKIWTVGKLKPGLYEELEDKPGELVGLTCDINDSDYNPEAEELGTILTICKWETIREL